MKSKECEYCHRWFDPAEHIDCPVCGPERRHDEMVGLLKELIAAVTTRLEADKPKKGR